MVTGNFMDDEKILERGGTEEDIVEYAEQNGANLTEEDVKKFEWWGYRHTNGSLQAKRYFDPRDLEDADESPFVAKRTDVFLAATREEALTKVGLLTK